MLVLGTATRPSIEHSRLRQSFGLTPAEARLLGALIAGERLPDYARRHGVSPTTARTHLRSLFDKTGERRQSDLIRRALSDPVLRIATGPQMLN